MRFFRGGLQFGTATFKDGETLRQRVKTCKVLYKRSRRYPPVFLTHMEPTRVGRLTLHGIV